MLRILYWRRKKVSLHPSTQKETTHNLIEHQIARHLTIKLKLLLVMRRIYNRTRWKEEVLLNQNKRFLMRTILNT